MSSALKIVNKTNTQNKKSLDEGLGVLVAGMILGLPLGLIAQKIGTILGKNLRNKKDGQTILNKETEQLHFDLKTILKKYKVDESDEIAKEIADLFRESFINPPKFEENFKTIDAILKKGFSVGNTNTVENSISEINYNKLNEIIKNQLVSELGKIIKAATDKTTKKLSGLSIGQLKQTQEKTKSPVQQASQETVDEPTKTPESFTDFNRKQQSDYLVYLVRASRQKNLQIDAKALDNFTNKFDEILKTGKAPTEEQLKQIADQSFAAQQAVQKEPETTTKQEKAVEPEETKQEKVPPSEFIDKLNKIKKAFKLNKEQTSVIKNLNALFMRATATLQEQKWSKKYVLDKIKTAVEGSEFSDFDELGKNNLIKILSSVFTTIYFPVEATPADKEITKKVEAVAEKAAEESPKQSSEEAEELSDDDIEEVNPKNDAKNTETAAEPEKNISDSDKETIKNIKEISTKITDEVINKIINIINSEFVEDEAAASLNEGASSSKAKQIINIINNLQLTDLEKYKLYDELQSFVNSKLKDDKEAQVDNYSFYSILGDERRKYNQAFLEDFKTRKRVNENLFSKFINNQKTLNKKQIFKFDGDTFKKYNRG